MLEEPTEESVTTHICKLTRFRYWAALAFHQGFEDTDIAIDIGCYVGYFTNLIPIQAIGVDIEPTYVNYANSHFKTRKTSFRCADAADLPYPDDTFRIAYIMEILEHLESPEMVMAEAVRVVMPEGRIVVCVPAPGMGQFIDKDHKKDFPVEWFTGRFNVEHQAAVGAGDYNYMFYILKNDKDKYVR